MKFIILLSILFLSFHSYSCSCRQHSIKDAFKNSDFVLLAKVESVSIEKLKVINSNIYREDSIKVRKYALNIIQTFKGDTSIRKMEVYSDLQEGACGLELKPNKKYIIYSNSMEKNTFPTIETYSSWTSTCTRTTSKIKKELECINNFELRNCYCENLANKGEYILK